MDRKKKQHSLNELNEKRQLENLIHKKNNQTKALKKLLKEIETDKKAVKNPGSSHK